METAADKIPTTELVNTVARAASGDVDAFRNLYEQFKDELYRASLAICRDEFYAEEAVQESFIKMFRKLNKLRDHSSFKAWAYRIVINSSYTVIKKHNRDWVSIDDCNIGASGDEESGATWQKLSAALSRLPKGYRNIFILHYLQELSHEQVAAVLSISVGTSKSQFHRARMQLRKFLSEQGISYATR